MARLILYFAVMLAVSGQIKTDKLPDGKGKAEVKRICSNCHDIGTVTFVRRTRIGWQQNVDDMISRGAEGSDEDMDTVIDYLTRFFGKINVNTASADDLQSALGLTGQEAQAIVTYREQHGNFKNFEQLLRVPGVAAEKLQVRRPEVAFSL